MCIFTKDNNLTSTYIIAAHSNFSDSLKVQMYTKIVCIFTEKERVILNTADSLNNIRRINIGISEDR